MTEKDSRQNNGRLGAHVVGQGVNGVPGLEGFPGRLWNGDDRP